MELRILGAHQGESDSYRFFSLMISESLALDAGSLTSSLSWEAQAHVRSLLLTHAHFDHIKDLNVLGFNHFNRGLHLDVYCLPEVRDAIRTHMFSRDIWLDLSARSTSEKPAITFHNVEPYRTFTLEDYEITPIPSIHTVPTVGYKVAKEGKSFYYTSDTGPGNVDNWLKANPDLMLTEVTYDSSMDQLAVEVSHLTPSRLKTELQALKKALGRLPRVVVLHINPVYQEEVTRELKKVATGLDADITIAYEGMRIAL